MSEGPKCPLGFSSGSLPIGHPAIPGPSSSSPSTADASAAAAVRESSEQKWNPYTLIALDAVFLVVVLVLAVYVPRWKNGAAASAKKIS